MASKGQTFITLFEKACNSHGDEECYISYDASSLKRRSISFKELWTLASRFAYNLKQYGMKRGDYIITGTPSSIESTVASFGIVFAGGSIIPLDKFYPNCEMIKEAVKMTKAKFLVLTESVENHAWPIFEPNVIKEKGNTHSVGYKDASLPSLEKIIIMNQAPGEHNPVAFLDHLRACKNEFQDYDLDPEDGCICPVSLNPGRAVPKPVELSHRAVVNTARLWIRRYADFGKFFIKYPWYLALCIPYDALNGLPRIMLDNNTKMTMSIAEFSAKVMELEGLTTGMMSPTDAKDLVDHLGDTKKTLFKHVVVSGQPMTRVIFETTLKLSTNAHIVYACSETGFTSMNSVGPGDTFTPLDAGFPLDGVEIRILDEDFKELPRGKTGRIAIRSPYLFTRYPGQPELTKSVWGEDGWFRSSDAGCLSADGHVHVFGRQGDLISRGIILTYPSWIEKPIMDIPDVLEVMAVPVPDDHNFKNICACVVLCTGSKLTDKDLLKLYEKSMSDGGVDTFPLDHVLIFEGSLPRLSRDKLGDLAAEKLGLQPNKE